MKKLLPPLLFLVFLVAMAGICWALGSPHTISYPYSLIGALSSFLLVALFWFITDRWYIRFEEVEMLKKFGEEYREYRDETPRWFGRV